MSTLKPIFLDTTAQEIVEAINGLRSTVLNSANIDMETEVKADSHNPVESAGIATALDTKQDKLVEGVNMASSPTNDATQPISSKAVYEALRNYSTTADGITYTDNSNLGATSVQEAIDKLAGGDVNIGNQTINKEKLTKDLQDTLDKADTALQAYIKDAETQDAHAANTDNISYTYTKNDAPVTETVTETIGRLEKNITDAVDGLDSDITANTETTKNGTAVFQKIAIVNGKLDPNNSTAVEVEKAGAAAEVLGNSSDAYSLYPPTVYSVKDLANKAKESADNVTNKLGDIPTDQTVAEYIAANSGSHDAKDINTTITRFGVDETTNTANVEFLLNSIINQITWQPV